VRQKGAVRRQLLFGWGGEQLVELVHELGVAVVHVRIAHSELV
jgi:hypothetical protein